MKFKNAIRRIKNRYKHYREREESFTEFLLYDALFSEFQRLLNRDVTIDCGNGKKHLFHHVFVHSIIIDDSISFKPNYTADTDFESWYVTKDEFMYLLESMYSRGFVLVKMSELLQGNVQLEKGKTPLVMSFDDINYYDFMAGSGFAEKLDMTRCDDCVSMLESFVKSHPDFSFNGARGIIAVTGYEGVLGYRDINSPELAELIHELKGLGFEFACHSWGHHPIIYTDIRPNGKRGISDMEMWFETVGKAVGKTDIFISPFGVEIRKNPILNHYLKRKGFRYFCSVGDKRKLQRRGKCFYMERFNIDGITLTHRNYDYMMYYGDPCQFYSEKRLRPYREIRKDSVSLVKHADFCARIPTVYFWDGMGEILCKKIINEKRALYPEQYGTLKCLKLMSQANGEVRCFDCSGLIKSFIMGGLYNFSYDPEKDYNSEQLLAHSPRSGDISSLPEVPGICLYMNGHVGIYIGNGQVIESTSNPRFGNGVVHTRLHDREWEKWFCCPEIEYEDEDKFI